MRRLIRFGVFALVAAVLICVAVFTLGRSGPRRAQPTAAAVVETDPTAPVVTELPTDVPVPTEMPAPTPTPTQSAEEHYITVAQKAALPAPRGDLPKGEWKIESVIASEGPSIQVTMPLGIAFNNEQFARQAKRTMAFVTKALFDADPLLVRINVIGTTPDGANQSELPVVSIVVLRPDFEKWDGLPENLTHWNISQRYL